MTVAQLAALYPPQAPQVTAPQPAHGDGAELLAFAKRYA